MGFGHFNFDIPARMTRSDGDAYLEFDAYVLEFIPSPQRYQHRHFERNVMKSRSLQRSR